MIGSFKTVIVMLLMLALGVGLGSLVMTGNNPATSAATNHPRTPATPTNGPFIKPVPEVTTQPAAEQQVAEQYLGVTFPRQSADIVARSEGRLEAVYVSLGDHLKPGDVIARIESSLITQQLEMAEASLRSIQAEEKNAEVEIKEAEARYDRREGLAEAGVLSKEELATAKVQVEKAGANLEVARARVAEQKARIKQIKESLAHTVIRAAFAGTVAARYLDPGGNVLSGTPIISLMRASDLWVRFAIPETRQATIIVGSAISFYIPGLGVAVPAVIEHVSPGVAAMSQELVVEARLNAPASLSGQIKPGSSGLVSLNTTSRRE